MHFQHHTDHHIEASLQKECLFICKSSLFTSLLLVQVYGAVVSTEYSFSELLKL